MESASSRSKSNLGLSKKKERSRQNANLDNVVVRKDFRDTMAWLPDLQTDKSTGKARVKVVFPDSLTTWNATVRAASSASSFGTGETNVVCNLPLVLRMQHPRFLVAGDRATLSANLHNRTKESQTLTVLLEAGGLEVESTPKVKLVVAPGEQKRVDWEVLAVHAGTATLTMKAAGDGVADAMQRSIDVVGHGMMRQLTESTKTKGTRTMLAIDLPEERKAGTTTLEVQVTPSLAVTMLDALPYLIKYPYGCVEQTMSRFMPAVMVKKTLTDLGVSAEDIEGRIFGGVEKQHLGKTHNMHAVAKGGKLDEVTKKGLKRLVDFQHSDGGWGWWKDGDSDDYMSAYVVWGLALARDAGLEVKQDVLTRGANYLDKRLVEHEDNLNQQAWMLHALSHVGRKASKQELTAMSNCYEKRTKLNAYSQALLTIAFQKREHKDTIILVTALDNGVRVDEAPDMSVLVHGASTQGSTAPKIAWWGKDRGVRWWYESGIETTAFKIMALLDAEPDNPLVDQAVLWLVKNRRGANWNNTKDTAIAVLALNQYLAVRKELAASYNYRVRVNGQEVGSDSVRPETALRAPGRFQIPSKLLRNGLNEIEVERDGKDGAVYVSATARFFSLENPIPASGHEIFVKRQYFRETKIPTLLKGHVTDLVELKDGDQLDSGDRVEVVMSVEAKNDLEYLLFEDKKPAGLEAVGVKSGKPAYLKQLKELVARARFAEEPDPRLASDYTGHERWVHQELRDKHIAIFADKLSQGFWEIRYTLRAETPGRFHALPVDAGAMYIPEIRGNSAEIRLNVR